MSRSLFACALLACVALTAAHPRIRSLDVGALTEFPADQWTMATEDMSYDRHLIAINNGLADYAGPPNESKTTKLEVYFPPLVLPTPMEMPGWKAEMYPCVSSGALQCDGWMVVSYTAMTYEAAFNNTFLYNFPIGIRLKNDCKCNTPLVCEVVSTESVPGVDATGDAQYLVWIPSIQYTSTTGTLEPDYAVFWTHNWDVWKGVRDNVRADALLDFSEHPLYVYTNGDEPSGDYKYSTGRRAVKAKIADWSNCNYMEFNGERIAPRELDVVAPMAASGSAETRALPADALAADAAPATDNTLTIAALAIAVVALVLGLASMVYAHMKISNMGPAMSGSVAMDGASAPMKKPVV